MALWEARFASDFTTSTTMRRTLDRALALALQSSTLRRLGRVITPARHPAPSAPLAPLDSPWSATLPPLLSKDLSRNGHSRLSPPSLPPFLIKSSYHIWSLRLLEEIHLRHPLPTLMTGV